jgi:hypothetical protein
MAEAASVVPIITYCDTVHLTTKDRLELFIPVCQAIQHAQCCQSRTPNAQAGDLSRFIWGKRST